MRLWTRQARGLGTVGGACLITVTLIWLLGTLNARPAPEPVAASGVATMVIHGPQTESNAQDHEEEKPTPETPTPEVMEVDAEFAPLEPPEPELLDLDLPAPTPAISPVRISVRKESAPTLQPPAPPRRPAKPRVRRADEVEQGPRESARNPAPRYPTRERQLGIEATVTLRLLIDEAGQVEDVQVVRGEDPFRQAVLDVIWRWRFSPAMHEGRPVKVYGLKNFRFQIRDRG